MVYYHIVRNIQAEKEIREHVSIIRLQLSLSERKIQNEMDLSGIKPSDSENMETKLLKYVELIFECYLLLSILININSA